MKIIAKIASSGKNRSYAKNALHTAESGNDWPGHDANAKRCADTDSDNSHGFGAMHFLSQISHQCHDNGRNRTGALKSPAHQNPVNGR